MRTHTPTDEQYDARLTSEARAQHAAILLSLKAGEPNNTELMFDALGQFVADDNALRELLLATARGENALQQVLNDLVWTEALARAENELARIERERAINDAQDRAERVMADRELAKVLV